jgi:hypothetical protein
MGLETRAGLVFHAVVGFTENFHIVLFGHWFRYIQAPTVKVIGVCGRPRPRCRAQLGDHGVGQKCNDGSGCQEGATIRRECIRPRSLQVLIAPAVRSKRASGRLEMKTELTALQVTNRVSFCRD